MAGQCGDLVLSLLSHNTKSKLINFAMYPGIFAKLADEREEVRRSCLSEMKTHWEAFEKAKTQRAPFWTARARRSCLALPLVEDIMVIARRNNFEDSLVMQAIGKSMFKGLNFSHLIEDHNQRQRVREEQACGAKDSLSNVAKWKLPLTKKVLSSLYKFDEVVASSTVLEPTERVARRVNKDWFSRPKGAANSEYKKIVGDTYSSRSKWPSPSPQSYYSHASELRLMVWAAETGKWNSGSASPWSRSLSKGLVYKMPETDAWWVSLGDVTYTSALAWPVDKQLLPGGRSQFVLKSISSAAELGHHIITDPEVIEVHMCKWFSPLGCFCRKLNCEGVVFISQGTEPMKLLRVAALNGFADNELPQLRYIAGQLRINTEGDAFDLALRLCTHILGEEAMSGETGLQAMAARAKCKTVDVETTMLDEEILMSCLAKDDAKEYEDPFAKTKSKQARAHPPNRTIPFLSFSFVVGPMGSEVVHRCAHRIDDSSKRCARQDYTTMTVSKSEAMKAYHEKHAKWREEILEKARNASSSSRSRRRPPTRVVGASGARRPVKWSDLPNRDWEATDFVQYVPGGFRFYKDTVNQRWQVACAWRSWSRSWTLRPSKEAAREVLVEAWKESLRVNGGVCHVTDLLESV